METYVLNIQLYMTTQSKHEGHDKKENDHPVKKVSKKFSSLVQQEMYGKQWCEYVS